MLSFLSIKNISILSDVEIDFHKGLNILTGETGAGKTFIIKSLALLAGSRASMEYVRKGQDKGEVSAIFNLDSKTQDVLRELGEELSELVDEEIVVKRVLEKSGKSKCFLNGSLVSASLLAKLGAVLLEITGQHQQQSLLRTENHKNFLDSYGSYEKELLAVSRDFSEYRSAKKAYEAARDSGAERHDYFRRIEFEKEELSQAALVSGEKEELEAKLLRLAKAEAALEDLSQAEAVLDGEAGLERQLSKLSSLLGSFKELSEMLSDAQNSVAELRLRLAGLVSDAEYEPDEIERTRERISEIKKLERKYGKSESELVSYFELISTEIAEFESGGFDLKNLEEALELTELKLTKSSSALGKKRRAVAKLLCKEVEDELKFVEMKKAKFDVRFCEGSFSALGNEKIEFFIAPNPGQGFSPLAKSASGGELSRILLVLKTIFGKRSSVATHIFDEVDSGVGGSAAQKIGEKLKALTRNSQVLVITHSPQVAAFADCHHYLSKDQSLSDTVTVHKELLEGEQVEEIARMLAGENVTKEFLQSAKALISEARASTLQ